MGAPKGEAVSQDTWHKGLRWTSELPARFPHRTGSASQAEDAVAVYRRALAGEPDTSVVVVTVGFFTNLRDLLLSGPDSLSELTGRELVERKVKRLVSMAGHFPEGLEFNVMMDAPAAAYVMEHWPSPVILSGFEIGEKIITGRRTAAEGPADSPVAEAYRMSLPQDNPAGRNSWDQSAVLVAVRGPEPGFGLERGTLTVDPSDSTDRWTPDPSGRHARLTFRQSPEQIAEQIESLMMHRPVCGRELPGRVGIREILQNGGSGYARAFGEGFPGPDRRDRPVRERGISLFPEQRPERDCPAAGMDLSGERKRPRPYLPGPGPAVSLVTFGARKTFH